MMKITGVIAVTLLLFSCGSPAVEEREDKVDVEVKDSVAIRNLVQEYQEFVSSLNPKIEQSVLTAAEKYAVLFAGSDQKICDSAYVLFDELYEKVGFHLNQRLMHDKTLEDLPCVGYDSLGKEQPYTKQFIGFRKSIEKHGFRIDCPEGMPEIGQDRSFVAKHFYSFVSPLMKQFLEAVRKEIDEPFSIDAGISITSQEYVERLIWWEKFNEANPNFICSEQAKRYQQQLFHFFLTGMDNTPILDATYNDYGELIESEVNSYFLEAYAYLDKKYPNSTANTLVKPYKLLLLKKEEAKRQQLLKTYTKKGLMIDFSNY